MRSDQWLLLLLIAILGILSCCRSVRDLERFAEGRHQAFSNALDLELPTPPCDCTLLYLGNRSCKGAGLALMRCFEPGLSTKCFSCLTLWYPWDYSIPLKVSPFPNAFNQ